LTSYVHAPMFLGNAAFNGAFDRNLFNFEHFNLMEIFCCMNTYIRV